MNQTQTRSLRKKVLSLILAVVMAVSLLPISAFASGDSKASTTATTSDGYEYNIMFLDCGRKYYSVDSIKQIIDNASAAGFNYIQLAVGNDGLRFLLDDMSLTVNGVTYSSDTVSKAIHTGNEKYYNFDVDELTQSEMDTIIAYAATKGMGVIPCVNTPGHMDAILDAAEELTGKTCSYNGSVRTIDVTNNTAVAFTQALLQKYINYFAGKGCQLFNMGADEYANDKYTGGSMGFGNLQSTGEYSYYVQYVNDVAKMIENAKMTPMAFNDGIYFNNNTSSGTFDTNIIICYWSSGWSGYTPMPASKLAGKGFKLINTNGDYYWVLGKTDAQCDAAKAGGFDKTAFPGGAVSNPVGSMFCIWADYPGAETEASVISKTAATIAAFGKALPQVKKVETVESKTVTKDNVTVTAPGLTDLIVAATDAPAIDAAAEGKVVAYNVTPATTSGNYKKNGTVTLPIPEGWDASRVRGFVQNEDGSITTVTGTPADGKFTFTVPHFSVLGVYELAANAATETKTINLTVGGTTTDTIDGEYPGTKLDDAVASVVGGEPTDKPGTTTYEPATLGEDTFYVSTTATDTAPTVQLTFENAGNGQYYIKNSAGQYVYPNATFEGNTAAKVETNQALSALGAQDIYGYDEAYKDSTKLSMGSAHKVTVSADMAKTWTPTSQWPTATFTFKGTGFDVISLTDNTSGAIFVDVYAGKGISGERVKSYIVDNYYGYRQEKDANGNITWVVDKDAKNALYQIPVMKINDLTYGEYTAVITVFYDGAFNQTTSNQYNFWLDAIRVYNPMGTGADANANYVKDSEGYPQYIKLRDSLAKDHTATAEAVFIDGGANANIQTYANYGPNNEVYLANGQAIAFTIPKNTNIASIQIGAKAPNGNAAEMDVNGTKTAIPSATEMYYQIATQGNQSFTVTNTGKDLLSLTNLKITFTTNPNTTVTLAALSDEDQENAVAQVRALFAAPAVEPFNPDRFDASWSRNVRKGETAKLTVKTSEDVEAITVNGETIDSFTERHERTGWGWWAKTVTFREFTYTDTATVTKDYTVCAVNGKGVSSDAITATLTVRPSVRDWLHGIFGKWF